MCTGTVQNMAGLVACRVVLGVLEAGFGAGVPYYLPCSYQRRELGFASLNSYRNVPVGKLFCRFSGIWSYANHWISRAVKTSLPYWSVPTTMYQNLTNMTWRELQQFSRHPLFTSFSPTLQRLPNSSPNRRRKPLSVGSQQETQPSNQN